MRLIVRADANPVIGAGHIMRLSSIIEEAISRGIDTHFIGNINDMLWVRERLENIANLQFIDSSVNFISNNESDILLLDSYTLDVNDPFLETIKWKSVITIVDDLTPQYKSDLRIHPGLSTNWPADLNILCGPRFIPIRRNVNYIKRKRNSGTLRIVIVGGGTDLFGFGLSVAKALRSLELDYQAIVFLKSDKSLPFEDSRFEFQEIGNSLDLVTEDADLILTTASTTCLEFIALEKAIGVLCGIENQLDYYKRITEIGLAAPLGRYEAGAWSIDSHLLSKLIVDETFRKDLQARTAGFIDGKGCQRILDEILKL
jgi:spore coat polysaccharide biosynthesis predicted glycosyltransferase SpsG